MLIEDSLYDTRVDANSIVFERKYEVNVTIYSADPPAVGTALRSLFTLGHRIGRPSRPHLTALPGIELLFDPLGYISRVGVAALYPENLDRTWRGARHLHYTDGIDQTLVHTVRWLADRADVEPPETERYAQEIRGITAGLGIGAHMFTSYVPTLDGIHGRVPEIVDLLNNPNALATAGRLADAAC